MNKISSGNRPKKSYLTGNSEGAGSNYDKETKRMFDLMIENTPKILKQQRALNFSGAIPEIVKARRIKPFANLLEKAIKVSGFNKSVAKTRIFNSPGVRLPKVAKFHINLNGANILAKHYGIEKQLKPDLYIVPLQGRDMNRFMEWQIIRLKRLRSRPDLFFYYAHLLMKRSNVFRVAAMCHCFPQGHRKLPLSTVININRKVTKIINSGSIEFEFKRRYIDKANGKSRPLGVPAPEGRIVLHMYQNFLLYYIGVDYFKNQHAYLPGRGTLTAGQQIMKEKLYNYPGIYSGDFKGFFDEIDNNMISKILAKFRIPVGFYTYLEKVNERIPKLSCTGTDNVYEKSRSGPLQNNYEPNSEFSIKHYNENAKDIFRGQAMNGTSEIPSGLLMSKKGVAQGAPTSPILANFIMQVGLNQVRKQKRLITVGYADDSISFSKDPIKLTDPIFKAPPGTGIEISYDKSHCVKRNGVGKAPLDFLGLRLSNGILQANTRKGSKLVFSSRVAKFLRLEETRLEQGIELNSLEDVLEFVNKSKELPYSSSGSGFEYFKKSTIGFAMSRLYQGNGNLDNLDQDFEYKYGRSSGSAIIGEQYKHVNLNTFNSSSYAVQSLCNIFRGNQLSKTSKRKYFIAPTQKLTPSIRWVVSKV